VHAVRCNIGRHRWITTYDYLVGSLTVQATCVRCHRTETQIVDLIAIGLHPPHTPTLEFRSKFGMVGPIVWNDPTTWTSEHHQYDLVQR
jgi:hypothetical protein